MTRRFNAAIVALLLLGFAVAARADYQVRDGNGNIITIKAGTTGAGETLPQSNPSDAFGNSLFSTANPGVTAPGAVTPDVRPASATAITIVDSGSASATGQNGVSFITGSPSVNSTASFTLNGQTGARVEVNGTWSGTLEFESSVDGGLSWVPGHCQVVGTVKLAVTVTANGDFLCGVAGATNFRVRSTAFASGVASVWVNFTGAAGPTTIISPRVMAADEGTDATYHAAIKVTTAASATDVVVIQGSSTKTIRIRRISLSAVAGSAIAVPVSIIRRSAGDTGGTSAGITVGASDINDPGPTAQVSAYTANPGALGAAVATIINQQLGAGPTTTLAPDRWVKEFGTSGGKSIVLRGTSDYLAINLNATTVTTLYGDVEFTEEQ